MMGFIDRKVNIPMEKSLIVIWAKKCNHTLIDNGNEYILTDEKTKKRYEFNKIIMQYPEDIVRQVSKNIKKQKIKADILFEPDYHKRRKLLSERYIKENLKERR